MNKTVSDTGKFFNNETSFSKHQEILSMMNVFRGIVVKNCTGNDLDAREDRKHNKTIEKESVLCCNEFWSCRCNVMHDEEEQK